jgi:transcriptional regulator with XRE-family HTH domain
MKQHELASMMCVTRQTVARLEKGDPAIAFSSFLLAVFCLQREKELLGLLAPEQDRLGLMLEIQKQEKRRTVKREKRDDLDF